MPAPMTDAETDALLATLDAWDRNDVGAWEAATSAACCIRELREVVGRLEIESTAKRKRLCYPFSDATCNNPKCPCRSEKAADIAAIALAAQGADNE